MADLDADIPPKPNPIDWPTPECRKAFAGERQLVCHAATLCAIHGSNKNPCVDVRSWGTLRAVMYKVMLRGGLPVEIDEPPPVYDANVVAEALRQVSEHLAGDGVLGQPNEAAATIPDEAILEPRKISELFDVPHERLRKRLERLRRHDLNCCVENENRRSTEAQYLYRMGSVRPILEDLRVSGKRPAHKKSE